MNQFHKDNLLKLAEYLESGKLKADFDMRYFESDENTVGPLVDHGGCGSVGCAIGHGPYAGIPLIEDDVNWFHYSKRVFGVHEFSIAWSWMFSSSWKDWDNTPEGAARRIRTFLDSGVPKDWVG